MSLKGVNEKMAWENKNFRKIGGMLGNEMGALEKERGLWPLTIYALIISSSYLLVP